MSLLQEIGEGSIKFSDLEIKLLLKKKDPKIEILKLIEKFEQTLPKEFKFYSTLNKSISEKEAETKQPLEIKITKSSLNKINITGHLNTELEKQIIKSYAKAIFAESKDLLFGQKIINGPSFFNKFVISFELSISFANLLNSGFDLIIL